MKSRILTLAALFFAVSVSGVYAQVQVGLDQTITASARVLSDFSFEQVSDLQFGDVTDGVTAVANVSTGNFENTLGGTQSFGIADITGAVAGDEMIISIADHATLQLTNGGDAIDYTPSLYTNGNMEATSGGNAYNLDDTPAVEVNGEGNLRLILGGSIVVPAEQESGTYTGNVVITVNFAGV